MFKKTLVFLLALTISLSTVPFVAFADKSIDDGGLTVVVDENFESCKTDAGIPATAMSGFFAYEANGIGDGYIKVQETADGGKHLQSHVFTQVYNETPIVGAYEFSLDVLAVGGSVPQCGVFVRALKTAPAFYEADGHPDTSTCQSGLLLYPRADQLGVNIKTYDSSWTACEAYVQNNTHMFDLPEGATYPYNLRVTDTAEEICIYVNDTLMCRITVSDPGKTYEKHASSAGCYAAATLYDAKGNELGAYTDTLLGSDGAIFGWATRANDMAVDDVCVKLGNLQITLLSIDELPSQITPANLDEAKEAVITARALYDSLSADGKAYISNYGKLTETEAAIAELEAALNVNWPDPTYKEMETTPEDTAEGTLQYTVSEDGTTVTISYTVNGNTISHTVPNNDNYLLGGYGATDDLGRSMFDSSEVGGYGEEKERYVGLFYFLCQGEHGDNGVSDLQKILDELGPVAAGSADCDRYNGSCWWGEPLYGYYYSNDTWVMRKHAELLTLANIDFLYFDVTNAFTYTHNAIALMSILHELNEQGFDAPQVVFYTNANSEGVIDQLYRDIYEAGMYPDTWFRINGKPVIIGPTNYDANGFFTVKKKQWPTDAAVTNGWPWMDFNWPQRIFKANNGDGSAISVSVAQHSGTVVFSDSSLYGDFTNRGRSYSNPNNVGHRWSAMKQDYRQTLRDSYEAWQADQSLTMQGINFQKQFDNAVESDAMYVLVTGWNEWTVGNNAAAHNYRVPFVFTDCASMEFSRDCEMMRGGYFDNYYIQLAYNVQRLKGTAPVVVQDSRKPINVTGGFDQWEDVTVTYKDTEGDIQGRNAIGFGHTNYVNTSGRNDIITAKVTSDTKNLYVYVQTAYNITMFDTDSSWMQIYMNTDRETTGWYGYDFILNHKAKDEFTTTVAKYNGTDGAYGFESCGEVSYRVKNKEMMIAVPLEMLGIEGYKEINVEFKLADSDTVYDEMEDFYIDGDVAPLGRMNYIYQNYIPGVSEITYPETETQKPEAPEESTEAPAESETEEGSKKGCGSVLNVGISVVILPMAVALLTRKRKERN